jgi:hypothetical protein
VKSRITVLLILVLALTFGFFQNCGGSLQFKNYSSMTMAQSGTLMEKKVWTLNSLFLTSRKMIFYANPNAFADDVSFGWLYTLNGVSGNCTFKPYESFAHAIEMECFQPGVVHLTLNVIKSDFSAEKLFFTFEVQPSEFYENLTDEDLMIPESHLVLLADGTPGPASGSGGGPGEIETSGATLYAAYCQTCHGSLDSTSKRKRTAAQIKSALSTQSPMKGLSFLSEAEINEIADALNF